MKFAVVLALLCAVLAVSVEGRYRRRHYNNEDHDTEYERRGRYRYNRHYDSSEEHSSEEDSEEEEKDDHVYRFQISEDDHGAYQYHDKDGYAKGFNIDLLFAVCEHANKECYFTLDKATNCWYNDEGHEYPGKGLMAGFYDGCLGLFPTQERKNSFDFSKPYTQNMKAALYYNPKAGLMDLKKDHNLAGHKIGFVQGWATSQTCLERKAEYHGANIGEYTAVMFEDYAHMVDAVLHDEVDAILAPRAMQLDQRGLNHTEPFMYCSTAGASVMTRYGSDVLNWWDKAFSEMLESGEYDELCEKEQKAHGDHGELYCVNH